VLGSPEPGSGTGRPGDAGAGVGGTPVVGAGGSIAAVFVPAVVALLLAALLVVVAVVDELDAVLDELDMVADGLVAVVAAGGGLIAPRAEKPMIGAGAAAGPATGAAMASDGSMQNSAVSSARILHDIA
jgi:hypothetical protein